jgi:hypothetical protein
MDVKPTCLPEGPVVDPEPVHRRLNGRLNGHVRCDAGRSTEGAWGGHDAAMLSCGDRLGLNGAGCDCAEDSESPTS